MSEVGGTWPGHAEGNDIVYKYYSALNAFLQKADESLLIQMQCACDDAMNQIRLIYGPFDEDEIAYYKMRLSDGTKCTVNAFQRDLIFNMFFKYFGDINALNAINLDDYVTLIIAARRILEVSGMVLLPYIISSKVVRLASRKSINKKELVKLEASPLWEQVKHKYRSEKIEKHILSLIAVILSSEFEIIDPEDLELDGQRISVVSEIVCEEILMYINLI